MTRTLHLDCPSGIAGDMTLAALIDAGADISAIESGIQSLGLPDLKLITSEVKKHGFRALHLQIEHPPEHAHRHLHHIEAMIDAAEEVEEDAKRLAKKIFHEVAVAEAHVHGSTLQKVHFHEVGAIDSIGDIVGVAIAMTQLGIEKVTASPIPTGTGFITIAHGRVSVPAPATAEILRGVPLASTEIEAELTTPTGAAIVKATAESFGAVPAMTIEAIGYGAGTRDLETQANLLRALIGKASPDTTAASQHEAIEHDHVHVMETQVDDATGEELAVASERIMGAGALDCFFSPVQMKKGRPGTLLTAVAADEKAIAVRDAIFLNTSTIGIRTNRQCRAKLIRREVTFDHQGTTVRAKEVELPNGDRRRKFEAADIERLATQTGRSFRELAEELSRL